MDFLLKLLPFLGGGADILANVLGGLGANNANQQRFDEARNNIRGFGNQGQQFIADTLNPIFRTLTQQTTAAPSQINSLYFGGNQQSPVGLPAIPQQNLPQGPRSPIGAPGGRPAATRRGNSATGFSPTVPGQQPGQPIFSPFGATPQGQPATNPRSAGQPRPAGASAVNRGGTERPRSADPSLAQTQGPQSLAPTLGGQPGGLVGQQQSLGDLINQQFGGLTSQVTGGLQDRLSRNLATIQQIGNQERRDINTQFNNTQSAAAQDLTSRGLSGTTVRPTVQAGIERNRADALGGLNERIAGLRTGVDSALSGDLINAQQALGLGRIGALGDFGQRNINLAEAGGRAAFNAGQTANNNLINAQSTLGLLPQDFANQIFNTDLSVLLNRNDLAPSSANTNQRVFQLFQGLAPAPSFPDTTGATLGAAGIQGGSTIAAAGLAAKIFVPQRCIDANARLTTKHFGEIALNHVRVGDEILCPDGDYHRVIDVDLGVPIKSRRDMYITIDTDIGSIIITADHPIGGKPAGEWKRGEKIDNVEIKSITRADPVVSGDVTVEGSDEYMANGFPITTVKVGAGV